MTCRLFGSKLLPESMQTYCKLGPYEQNLTNYNENVKIEAFEVVTCNIHAI